MTDSPARLRAAERYHRALSAGLALTGSRALADGPTEGELLMEAGFGLAMRPALASMYQRPIDEGLTAMVGMSREEIAGSVLAFYRERPDTLEEARRVLGRYARRGFELGGVFNPMGGIPSAGQIPLHSRCRCYYSPLTDGWVKPALIWTGFALGLLSD